MLGFRIVFQDDDLVVIDKPTNFHTHAPEDRAIRLNRRWDATTILRKQLGIYVAPVHRLDRQTSGLVVFAKTKDAAKSMSALFQEQKIEKTYFGVTCGKTTEGEFRVDRPLKSPTGELLPSVTIFRRVFFFQLEFPDSKVADFSILRIQPETGRFHQIRRHLAGIHAPILYDRKRGNKPLNRAVQKLLKTDQMYLRAMKLEFTHPRSQERVVITTRWTKNWHYLFERIGFCPLAI